MVRFAIFNNPNYGGSKVESRKRNRIAWTFMVKKYVKKEMPPMSLSKYISETLKIPEELSVEFLNFFSIAIMNELGYEMAKYKVYKIADTYKEIAWLILVEKKYREGIKIGQLVKRQVHSEADEIGISKKDAMDFARSVIEAVVNKTFDN